MLDIGKETKRRVIVRVLGWLFIANLISQVDRVNVSFAALQMNRDLAFTPEIYGFGAGIFFVGYALVQVPSNLTALRIGAARILPWMMIAWGAAACAMAVVWNKESFFIIRFMLGVAEGGLTPMVPLCIAGWLPKANRGEAISIFTSAAAIAAIIAGPSSTSLMGLHFAGLRGWQTMFVVEGIPAIVVGVLMWRFLPNGPETATWLPQPHRQWLLRQLAVDNVAHASPSRNDFAASLRAPAVWVFTGSATFVVLGTWGLLYWLPQLIHAGFGALTTLQIGFVATIPFIAAALAIVLVGRSSDATGDRRWHLAVLALLAGSGLLISTWAGNRIVDFIAISIAISAGYAFITTVFTAAAIYLAGTAMAGALAVINATSSLGGFFGLYIFGILKGYTHSTAAGIALFSAGFFLAALLPICFGSLFPAMAKAAERVTPALQNTASS